MVYTFRKVILFTGSFAVVAKPWFIGRIRCTVLGGIVWLCAEGCFMKSVGNLCNELIYFICTGSLVVLHITQQLIHFFKVKFST